MQNATKIAPVAGRELNAEISERIMGIQACRCVPRAYDQYTGNCRDCGRRATLHYSQEIWAAWHVVDKLEHAWHLELKRYAVGWLAVFSTHDRRHAQEAAETPAEAICLAALAAVAQNPDLLIPISEKCA